MDCDYGAEGEFVCGSMGKVLRGIVMSEAPPICVGCRQQYMCDKNEVWVCDPEAGGFASTYWQGDQWICAGCGHTVIVGRGQPVMDIPKALRGESLEFQYSSGRENSCGDSRTE